jgi:uncharacterized membrane protein
MIIGTKRRAKYMLIFKLPTIAAISVVLTLGACTNPDGTPDNGTTGALVGAGIGAFLGNAIGGDSRSAVVGGIIGGTVGGLAGDSQTQQYNGY